MKSNTFIYLLGLLTVLFTLALSTACRTEERSKLPTSQVFPGDTNNDNIVNHQDLLAIGAHFNATGEQRPDPTNDASEVADWKQTKRGLNAKHADADGNGVVNAQDTVVIVKNYGKTNPTKRPTQIQIPSNSPVLSIDAELGQSGRTVGGGLPVTLKFKLSNTVSLDTISGIAFTILTNGKMQSFVTDDYSALWLGTKDDLLFIKNIQSNSWDLSIVRKDGEGVPSAGDNLLKVSCIVTVDFGVTQPVTFDVKNAVLISTKGNFIPLSTQGDSVMASK